MEYEKELQAMDRKVSFGIMGMFKIRSWYCLSKSVKALKIIEQYS